MKKDIKHVEIKKENELFIINSVSIDGNVYETEFYNLSTVFQYAKTQFNEDVFLKALYEFNDKYNEELPKFVRMLLEHKLGVQKLLMKSSDKLLSNAIMHDLDKLFNTETFNIYNEHFPILKAIEWGTKEYQEYEEKYFYKAHWNHNQEEHQFYDFRHQPDTKVDLVLLLEVVADITFTAYSYGNKDAEKIAKIIFEKPTMNHYVTYETIYNTVVSMVKNIERND